MKWDSDMGGGSEISSASASSSQRKGRRPRWICDCGREAPLKTAWTDENPGRRFWGCGHFKVDQRKGCEFFEWHDGEVNEREKRIIRGLLKRNDELKRENRLLVGGLVMSWCVFFILVTIILTK